jgi:hypothetical protein
MRRTQPFDNMVMGTMRSGFVTTFRHCRLNAMRFESFPGPGHLMYREALADPLQHSRQWCRMNVKCIIVFGNTYLSNVMLATCKCSCASQWQSGMLHVVFTAQVNLDLLTHGLASFPVWPKPQFI